MANMTDEEETILYSSLPVKGTPRMTRSTYLATLDRMLDAMQHDTLLDDRYGAALAALVKYRAVLDAPNGPSPRVIDAVRELERAFERLKGSLG